MSFGFASLLLLKQMSSGSSQKLCMVCSFVCWRCRTRRGKQKRLLFIFLFLLLLLLVSRVTANSSRVTVIDPRVREARGQQALVVVVVIVVVVVAVVVVVVVVIVVGVVVV
ncbi:unnamed protein product, partial [Polarella glacialis]